MITGDSSLLSTDPTITAAGSKADSYIGSSEFSFVGSASKASVSVMLAGASANLNKNGLVGGDLYEQMISQAANVYLEDNDMTSQQISDALYSGQNVELTQDQQSEDAGIQGEVDSLNNFSAYHSQLAANLMTWEAGGRPQSEYSDGFLASYSDDQLNAFISEMETDSATEASQASGIAAAFANHTLGIEKATDVQGLDYSETVWMTTTGNGGAAGLNQSYSQAFLNSDADGKHHLLESASTDGNVMLYLTW